MTEYWFFWNKYRKLRIVIFPEMGPCPHLLTLWSLGFMHIKIKKKIQEVGLEITVEVEEPYTDLDGTKRTELVDVRKETIPIQIEINDIQENN